MKISESKAFHSLLLSCSRGFELRDAIPTKKINCSNMEESQKYYSGQKKPSTTASFPCMIPLM